MKKSIISIVSIIVILTSSITANAATVPRESAPCYATENVIVCVEMLIGDILNEVQNGLWYADARAKSHFLSAYFDIY